MKYEDITTWSVSKGVVTPVNPHCPDITFSTSIVVKSKLFAQFEESVKGLIFATNAPDGSYSAGRFGEIEHKIEHTKGWSKISQDEYDNIYKNSNVTLRSFLPFIDQIKEAESPKFGEWISVKEIESDMSEVAIDRIK